MKRNVYALACVCRDTFDVHVRDISCHGYSTLPLINNINWYGTHYYCC